MLKSTKRRISFILVIAITAMMLQFGAVVVANAETSGDAYVNYDAGTKTWTMGTAAVEKKVQFNGSNQFLLVSFKNKATGREYIQGTQNSDEFSVKVDTTEYNGLSSGWIYDNYSITTLPVPDPTQSGALQLVINFHNSVVKISRTYVVYPNTGAIQEWSVFTNVSGSSRNFSSPYIFKHRVMQNDIDSVDFLYMTGGGNFTGSNILKTVAMTSTYARNFNSYDSPEVMTVDGQNANALNDNKQGTAIYNEFFVLRNRATSEGMWLTFDYNGHWYANIGNYNTRINVDGYASMTNYVVANNASITAPKSTFGVFTGDIDDMGNNILNYVYRYQWDYTRNDFAGAGGTWQWRVNPQMPNAFESANLCRYAGGGTVHVDDNWFDKKGDWSNGVAGDNFAKLNEYANKSGIRMKVWMPFWHVDPGSQVVNEHPDWVTGGDNLSEDYYGLHLNLANTAAYNWILNKATAKQTEWGSYIWRYDGQPAWTSNGSDNDMLNQSNNFFSLLKQFKDNNPNAWIEGCSSGGEMLMQGAVRFSDSQQLTDGASHHYTGYYNCLTLPYDKIGAFFPLDPDLNKENWFNYLDSKPTDIKEKLRKATDLEKYLQTQGLYGRYVKIYRPAVNSGDKTYFLQKVNADSTKSMFMISQYCPYFNTNITIYPKGLVPGGNYTVRSVKGSCATQTQTGSYWMTKGVSLTALPRGEVILFNVGNYPGSGSDATAPGAPTNVKKKTGMYCDNYGVELNWASAADNNWVSYYEIFKNGVSIDKVSRGTFCFTTDADINDTYQVRTVDGDGNVSSMVTATLDTGATPVPSPTPAPKTDVYKASTGFSATQGKNNWSYLQQYAPYTGMMYLMNMNWDAANGRWQGNEPYSLIMNNHQHPGNDYNSVRKWIADRDDTVLISGSVSLGQPGQGGDGVVVSIRKSGEYPFQDSCIWGPVTVGGNDAGSYSHNIQVNVKKGDAIYFVVNKNTNNSFDITMWDPVVTHLNWIKYTASEGFSSQSGRNQWTYKQFNGSMYSNMYWNGGKWQGNQPYCLVDSNWQHPDANDSVREWTAPKSGTIRVKGNVAKGMSGGDGITATIKKNGTTVWGPVSISGSDTTGANHDFTTSVNAGDTIDFIVNKNNESSYDLTNWNPAITYGTEYAASEGFSSTQGQNHWYYQQLNNGVYSNMNWDAANGRWQGSETYALVMNNQQHPEQNYDSVRKWVAPQAGNVTIRGYVAKGMTGGDGVIATIKKNGTTIWGPVTISENDTLGAAHVIQTSVSAGDAIYFIVNKNGNTSYDLTTWDPSIVIN